MDRRKFLIGAGSFAAAGAGAIGTGAFSSAELKDREAFASVVNDSDALLKLDPSVSDHARETNSGEVIIDLQDLNQNADFTFDQLVRITNEGNQTVNISVDVSSGLDTAVDKVPGEGGPDVANSSNLRVFPVEVEPAEYVDVGAEVTTTSGTGTFNPGTFTVNADEP